MFLLCLLPALLVVGDAFGISGSLGANPIENILDRFGNWALRFIMITLAVTPLRRMTNWNWLSRFRRMFGLFTFFYAFMHFITWLVLDRELRLADISEDLLERPFITLGFRRCCMAKRTCGYFIHRHTPAHGTKLADTALRRLRHRHTGCLALLVAGQERHHRTTHLRRNSQRPARSSYFLALTAQIETQIKSRGDIGHPGNLTLTRR